MLENTSRMQKIVVTSTAVTGAVLAAPVMADAALGDDTLRPGDSKDDVKKLQDLLREAGHFTYHTSTGYYGDRTKEAVLSFQRQHNLAADGIAGPQTFSVLLTDRSSRDNGQAVATASSSNNDSLGTSSVFRMGDKHAKVKTLQRRLQSLGYYKGGLDSHYGRQTAAAVRKFQKNEQLAVDGIAGPQTLAALQGASSADKSVSSVQSLSQGTTFKVLSIGDKGNEISQLQQQLKDLGYYKSNVTGVFGPITEEAVRKFQRKNSLTVDGMAGPKTLNKLRHNPKQSSTVTNQSVETNSSSSSVLRYQSRGTEVERLQNELRQLGYMKMEATGVYGEVTEQAVRSFQQAHGLTADGIAGPVTHRAIQQALHGNVASESQQKKQTPPSGSKVDVTNLVADAAEHVGTPYVWGGTSSSGFDCSGFLQYVFRDNGVELPRTVAGIYDAGTSVSNPRVGDIVFFETYTSGPSHAGIYLGNNQFIHAGTSTGVTVSNLTSSYWEERYIGTRRYY
ncbi:Putative peptidoglycan binding domain-containing protein [Alteribacillus iranensis]|uniref:Putative peptidoglycan binding domain-containing protein n=2 Tax=Alteribacillus iranensis TaxID=930128 RepID=A0A1I2BWN1_9BACI|nr:Putative peptidoglycan binding domain-containing protein [Alteribacillus iranensis]